MKRARKNKRKHPWLVGAMIGLVSSVGIMFLRRRRKGVPNGAPEAEPTPNHVAGGTDDTDVASMGHA